MDIFESIKNLIRLFFPTLVYYFIEAMFFGIFVQFIWRFFLSELFNLYIGYFQWVCIIWIVKIIFFDVFKIVGLLNNVITIIKNNEENELNQENEI